MRSPQTVFIAPHAGVYQGEWIRFQGTVPRLRREAKYKNGSSCETVPFPSFQGGAAAQRPGWLVKGRAATNPFPSARVVTCGTIRIFIEDPFDPRGGRTGHVFLQRKKSTRPRYT